MQVTVSYPSASGSDYSNRNTIATPKGKPTGVIVESDDPEFASVEEIYERWESFGFIDESHLQYLFDIAGMKTEDRPYEVSVGDFSEVVRA